MRAQPSSVAPLSEVPSFDLDMLQLRGWVLGEVPVTSESAVGEQLLAMASQIGEPVASRVGGSLCERLHPILADSARPNSLSKIYSLGEFPLHVDTAHWLTPCRYVMLACLSPGDGYRPTVLLDTLRLPIDEAQFNLLHSAPFRIKTGRNSFFSTILSRNRSFVRYDPGCMKPVTSEGDRALDIFSKQRWPAHLEEMRWSVGKVLLIDNWRVLHGRGNASCPDDDRTLLRISIR